MLLFFSFGQRRGLHGWSTATQLIEWKWTAGPWRATGKCPPKLLTVTNRRSKESVRSVRVLSRRRNSQPFHSKETFVSG